MILRSILPFFILSFYHVPLIRSQTNVPTPEPTKTCDPGMFSCIKDSSCIPMDWVGDNELDCSDGSDEHSDRGVLPSLPTAQKSNKTKQKIKEIPPTSKPLPENPENSQDATQEHLSSQQSEDPTPCSPQDEKRVNECSKNLESWIENLAQIDFSTFSLLSNETSISKIEQGCGIFNDFMSCTDGLPASCQPENENVRDFQVLQMLACELLVPSVKEHRACFSALDQKTCPIVKKSTKTSTFCSLADSISSQIECITNTRPSTCNEAAIEMFEPIKMETQHSLEDLNCLADQHPSTSSSIDQKPTEHEIEEEPNGDKVQEVKPVITESVENNNTAIKDLSNSLNAFGNAESVCGENGEKDIWSMVRARICSRKNDLLPHSKCFLDTELKEKRCNNKLTQQTQCAAIDTFNKNVDCTINALNELCPIEAQDVVIAIQEGLNDDAIQLKCYEEKDAIKLKDHESTGDPDFKLQPKNPRCNSEQENNALVCLVELIEINNKLTQFRSTNFLVEISDSKSKLINPVCELYSKYETCLNNSVFNGTNGQRCSFASPLNTLARIGLSPICGAESRQILIGNKDCLQTISKIPTATQCQSGLQHLGKTVELMLQGIHSEALLCNTFYMLRNTFECGQSLIKEHCDANALNDLSSLKEKITELGIVEGCPKDKPEDLDKIISRPVNRPQLRNQVPVARPMANNNVPIAPACEQEEQKKFGECIQPLTAFQPHPLAVIKQPKEIDNACKAYKTFNECRVSIQCNPLWARGMSAMFEFACGPGYERFNKVRQCIRKTTTREDIRECVNAFSKGAPQKACESSNRLLACAVPPIKEKCGPQAVEFVKEYVQHFASTIDPQCNIGEPVGIKAIHTYNCTASEDQVVQQCSAPLNDLGQRLEELFQGGLQSFLKNLNNLAPVFAQGCNLTNEFRECAKPILDANNSCTVSSCLVKSGNGICNQPDVAAAIDTQLGCIFKQVSDPEFGKCLRSTIATLKEFNLVAIREILPKFTTCIQPIVMKKCGAAPLNVLRALGSKDVCPISYKPQLVQIESAPTETTPVCTESMREEFQNCSQEFYAKYSFEPMTILNKEDDPKEVCQDIDAHQSCFDQFAVCEQQKPGISLRSLIRQICSSQEIFKQHQKCLSTVKQSETAKECLKEVNLSPRMACPSMSKMVDCAAKEIQDQCGEGALKFMVDTTNDYLHNLNSSDECMLSVPTIALETGCSEQQLIQYLECEALVDNYRFRPITFISNASGWDSFCEMIGSKYRPCLDKLECRFEPVSTASLMLFENLCEREITRRDQRKHAECLGEVADSQTGKKCLEAYKNIDFLAKDAPEQVCLNMGKILSCIGLPISKKCGTDALLHVYDIHGTWVRVYNSTCVLQPSEVANNIDAEPTTQSETTTIPLTSTTTIQIETTTTIVETTKSTLPASVATKSSLYHTVFIVSAIWFLF